MIDISFTGGNIIVKSGGASTTISEFSDEGTPVECNEIEVTGHAVTLNGQVIFWRKPNAYVVAVTVIPMSDNDITLGNMLEMAHVKPGEGGAAPVSKLTASLTINCPKINESGSQSRGNTWSFQNGRIVSGPTGPSTSSEGKMTARTYTFVFETLSRNASGTKVS
jgi:uncharacterized protein YodC (DUF2158 family)